MADILEQDPYGGFDIMDFDRPSLRPKKKGRKFEDAMPFEFGDPELETTMRSTWENDREKKRLKKAERAELRAQGLLGRGKKGKADLKEKYAEGMMFRQLRDEIKGFLMSTENSLPLPPMDKNYRKIVHEICLATGLKSQSRGSGKNRSPVIYKTARPVDFDDSIFAQLEKQIGLGFFPRLDRRSGGKGVKAAKGGFGGVKAVSYQDGDVVGAAAPEIAAGNKGRAMLEKMGWSVGQRLGTADNKGILLPIAHIVKTSKAGLG